MQQNDSLADGYSPPVSYILPPQPANTCCRMSHSSASPQPHDDIIALIVARSERTLVSRQLVGAILRGDIQMSDLMNVRRPARSNFELFCANLLAIHSALSASQQHQRLTELLHAAGLCTRSSADRRNGRHP